MKIRLRWATSTTVFATLAAQVRSAVRRGLESATTAIQEALRPAPIAIGLVRDGFRTHKELVAENATLRLQLIVAARKVNRPALRAWERGALVALASRLPNW